MFFFIRIDFHKYNVIKNKSKLLTSKLYVRLVIESFAASIVGLLSGCLTYDFPPSGTLKYADFYTAYFDKERDWYIEASVSDITALFAGDPVYKLELLAELLYREAQELADVAIQKRLYRKLIDLYEVIDLQSKEFSLERMNRIVALKRQS